MSIFTNQVLTIRRSWKTIANGTFLLTNHAWQRMNQRGIKLQNVIDTLEHGSFRYARGARIYYVGRKDIANAALHCIDLRACDGIQVIVPEDGEIRTVYRNREIRRIRKR